MRTKENALIMIVPRYVPIEIRNEIRILLEPILKPLKLKIMVIERVGRIPSSTKCPVCNKKFEDVSSYRALNRLQQHIRDKHSDLVKCTVKHPDSMLQVGHPDLEVEG